MKTLFVEYNGGILVMYEDVYNLRIERPLPNQSHLIWSSNNKYSFTPMDIIRTYWEEEL